MDSLTTLYYIAPVSAVCSMLISVIFESSSMNLDMFLNVGLWPFLLNGIGRFVRHRRGNQMSTLTVTLFARIGPGRRSPPILASSRRVTSTNLTHHSRFVHGAVSFGLNVAAVSVVKNTSTLTFGLAGVLKDILIVGMAMLFYGTPMTWLQAFGYTMAMTGLMYYKSGKVIFGLCSGGCRLQRSTVRHCRRVAQIGLLSMVVASCVLLYRIKDEVRYVDQATSCTDNIVQLAVVQEATVGSAIPEGFPASDKVAVIVEPRTLPSLVPLIMHFAGVLAWDWNCEFPDAL